MAGIDTPFTVSVKDTEMFKAMTVFIEQVLMEHPEYAETFVCIMEEYGFEVEIEHEEG